MQPCKPLKRYINPAILRNDLPLAFEQFPHCPVPFLFILERVLWGCTVCLSIFKGYKGHDNLKIALAPETNLLLYYL
jgi:hypothetical protein